MAGLARCSKDERSFGRVRRTIAALAICVLLLPAAARAGDGEFSPQEVKAAFLINFLRFVEWPPTSFDDPSSAFRICILGDDAFLATTRKVAKGWSSEKRGVEVRKLANPSGGTDCHVLFVSQSRREVHRQVIRSTRKRPVLTVSESTSFADLGGIVSLVEGEGKVKLEINRSAAEAANLSMSARLLRLAKLVD